MMDPQQMAQPYGGTMGGGVPIHTNPLAQQLQSKGRGEDTMLVHMTPNEVNSLQGLAMAHGGSLTINPETGLPEAGFLKKLLPTLLGAALTATGIGAPLAAGLVAAGSVAKTGSLKKGLMAGLQAYGGASLAGGLGLGSSISNNAFGALSSNPGILGANMGAGAFTPAQMANYINSPELAQQFATKFGSVGAGSQAGTLGASLNSAMTAPDMMAKLAAEQGASTAARTAAGLPTSMGAEAAQGAGQAAAKKGLAGIAQRFGDTAKAGLPGGMIGKAAPMLAASGLMQGVTGAMTPSAGSVAGPDGQVDNSYQGPYYAQDRQRILDPEGPLSSKQRRHFAVDMPEIYNTMGQVVQPGSHTVRGTQIMQPVLNPKAKKGQPMYNFTPVTYQGGIDPNEEDTGYASGGEVQLSDGAFVLDARTVSEIGNGSSNAGIEALSRMGGHPVQGRGDGVSDSVPARIGKDQPARVARDEVIMPANVVRRIGKGNPQRGADKLYALMDKAHKARKKAGRGQDTKLSRGLG
jgi:hypothetical protein